MINAIESSSSVGFAAFFCAATMGDTLIFFENYRNYRSGNGYKINNARECMRYCMYYLKCWIAQPRLKGYEIT